MVVSTLVVVSPSVVSTTTTVVSTLVVSTTVVASVVCTVGTVPRNDSQFTPVYSAETNIHF